MKQVNTLKNVVACYLCYMVGGFLSALFTETNNRTGAIIAIAVPTVIAMVCFTMLTRQIQPAKKKLPVRRGSRLVATSRRGKLKVVEK